MSSAQEGVKYKGMCFGLVSAGNSMGQHILREKQNEKNPKIAA